MRQSTLRLLIPVGLIAFVVLLPLLSPDDPTRVDFGRIAQPPGPEYLLGTDRLGRDLLSRFLYGARISLGVAFLASLGACLVGALLGALAGLLGGRVGGLLDRLVDIALALPVFFVALALQAALPTGAASVVLVLTITGWMTPARAIRAEAGRLSRMDYIEAAHALGLSRSQVFSRHIAPHLAGLFGALLTAGFGEALLLQSTLSFLGLGIPPPEPTWGGMLLDSLPELARGAWWLVLVPGAAILASTMAARAIASRMVEDERISQPWR